MNHPFSPNKFSRPLLTLGQCSSLLNSVLEQIANLSVLQIYGFVFYLLVQSAIASPFPEEVILTTMGLLWSRGQLHFLPTMLVCQAGILAANAITFSLGAHLGSRLLGRRPLKWLFKKESVDAALNKIREKGLLLVFVTRFTPMVRAPFYFAAGVSGMKLRRFSRVDALASCIQVPLLLLLGAYVGKSSGSLVSAYGKIGLFMGLLMATGFFIQNRRGKNRKIA